MVLDNRRMISPFFTRGTGTDLVLLLVYVDDIIVTDASESLIRQV